MNQQGRIPDIRCAWHAFFLNANGPTDGRTDTPSYRDATAHLKKPVLSIEDASILCNLPHLIKGNSVQGLGSWFEADAKRRGYNLRRLLSRRHALRLRLQKARHSVHLHFGQENHPL